MMYFPKHWNNCIDPSNLGAKCKGYPKPKKTRNTKSLLNSLMILKILQKKCVIKEIIY